MEKHAKATLHFDNGTIVTSGLEKVEAISGVLKWDERTKNFRAMGRSSADINKSSAFSDLVYHPKKLQQLIRPLDLRNYQMEAISAWQANRVKIFARLSEE